MKKSELNGKELMKQILGPIEWSNEELDKALLEQIECSKILKHEFVVKDDITDEEIYLFEDYDNPFLNTSAINEMVEIEDAMLSIPKDLKELWFKDQKELMELLKFFNSLKSSCNWQLSVFTEKFRRYENAVNFLYNLKLTQGLETLEIQHSEITKLMPGEIERIDDEKNKAVKEKEDERLEERNKFEKEIRNDEELTSVEIKKKMKDFDEETTFQVNEILNRYKNVSSSRQLELKLNRDAKYKLISNKYAEAISTSSIGYGEAMRKMKIIELIKDYFQNRSDDLNGIIITLNSIHKNTIHIGQ